MKRYELRAIRAARAAQRAHRQQQQAHPMHLFYLDCISRKLPYLKAHAGRLVQRMVHERMREARLTYCRRLP